MIDEEPSLLREAHEDSDKEEDLNCALISNKTADPTYPESSDTLTADEERFVDEDSAEELAVGKTFSSVLRHKKNYCCVASLVIMWRTSV